MQSVSPQVQQPFLFDGEFQKSLLRLLMEDGGFASVVADHLEPQFFENEVLGWMFAYGQRHRETYQAWPSLRVYYHQVQNMDPQLKPLYQAVIEQVGQASLRDEQWMRDQTVDFVKRNLFVRTFQESRALYNEGATDKAYDLMMERMDKISRTTWEAVDESDFFEALPARHNERMDVDPSKGSIGTGIPGLDTVLSGGLSVGELGIIIAYSKCGKALRDDQVVRTPSGWSAISDLQVGDAVIGGSTGESQTVTGVYPQGVKDLYEVNFSDGGSVVACKDHLWTVQTSKTVQRKRDPSWVDVSTRDLCGLVDVGVWVPNTPLVSGSGNPLGMDPYLFGLLLGDGGFTGPTIRFHKPEEDLWEAIEKRLPQGDSIRVHRSVGRNPYVSIVREGTRDGSSVRSELSRLGLVGLTSPGKFIPEDVFTASEKVRRGVLSGLCDTDGHVVANYGCSVEFSSASKELAVGVVELCRGLGGYARLSPKVVKGVTYWLVRLTLLDGTVPVLSDKNVARSGARKTTKRRRVVSVVPVDAASCTCITVDDPEHLFITNDYLVTHNSTFLVNFGVAATRLNYRRTAHFVFEGKRERVEDRYDAAFMDEFYSNIKRGELSSSKKYSDAYELYQSLRGTLKIRGYSDRWDYSVVDIHEDLKRWKRESGWVPEMVIVDYGDLLSGREKTYVNETAKQKAAFRDLKSLADRGYALWTASQAQRPDKGSEDQEHILRSRQIADCYAKVHVADFLGTQNITREERKFKRSRLYAELYRENEAEQEIPLICDFSKMTIKQADAGLDYNKPDVQQPPPQQNQVTL